MNFPKYIDNRFQEVSVLQQTTQIQDPDAFPVIEDAEIKALSMVLNSYRTFLKWLLIPKIILGFLLMKLHLTSKPGSPLLDKLKKDQQAAREKTAQKVGMIQKVQNEANNPNLIPLNN
jgi:hypothetical protein